VIPLSGRNLLENEMTNFCEISSRPFWAALDLSDEASYDTQYVTSGANGNQYYSYKGGIYSGNEINYYGIGMYEAWKGSSLEQARELTLIWKSVRYLENPSPGTLFFLAKGYNDYLMFAGKR
jgi:hypothetical protein